MTTKPIATLLLAGLLLACAGTPPAPAPATTPTPTEPPYVAVGDRVSVGTTLGQLEAMKLFTPLTLADFNSEFELYDSEREYEVTRINMSSGQQVNVGDLLLVVKPV